MSASMGTQARLSMAASGTAIGSYTEAHEFISESLRKTNSIVDTNGITGSRSHKSERTRLGLNVISGSINYPCSPSLMDLLLPRILGASASGTTFALAETLPAFDVLIDRIARRFVYGGCLVNKATFKFSPGEMVTLDLDILGSSETVSATAFPSITAPTDAPYVFSDVTGSFVGSSRTMTSLEITIDNALKARTSNSLNATDISPTDRIITVKATTPYTSSEADLYGQSLSGSAATVSATNGNTSLTFSFGTIQFPDNAPVVSQRNGEIMLEITGTARKTGSTMELVVTNDSST